MLTSCSLIESCLPEGVVLCCRFDATQMRKRVAETTRWQDVPHLDEAFIQQNMRDLVALQIIGPPGQPHPQAKVSAPQKTS